MTSFIERTNLTVKNDRITLKEKWHRTLGHVNFNYLNTMSKIHILEGLPNEVESDYFKCAMCIENKMHNIPKFIKGKNSFLLTLMNLVK